MNSLTTIQFNTQSFKIQYCQQYYLLKDYLLKYKTIKDKGGWSVIKTGKLLSQGVSDPSLKKLKQRLFITGELSDYYGNESDTFDITLKNAIKQFQKNHRLDTTGIVDGKTLHELNVPVSTRIHQIEINMERWKKSPIQYPKTHISVNLAANKLDVIVNDSSIMDMKIIVGRYNRKTPTFNGDLTIIEFNPYWIIPPGIIKKDILPKILKNASYIQTNGMQVFIKGKKEDPKAINWNDINSNDYQIIQKPSVKNPLGVVKFSFPNNYFVYMHDTPLKKLFEVPYPAFSSGCIRLSKAVDLAKCLLKVDKNWVPEKIDSLISTAKNIRTQLNKPIKIYITYYTVWVNKEGFLQFAPDIYKKDVN